MTLEEYHARTRDTASYPAGITYPVLGLISEIGELAGQVAKSIRDDGGKITPERRVNLTKEIGDVLWMCAAVSHETGSLLSEAIRCSDFSELSRRAVKRLDSGSIITEMVDEAWRIMRSASEGGWRRFKSNTGGEVQYAIEKVVDALVDFAAYYRIDIGQVANENIAKLADRKRRGVIAGSGDNR